MPKLPHFTCLRPAPCNGGPLSMAFALAIAVSQERPYFSFNQRNKMEKYMPTMTQEDALRTTFIKAAMRLRLDHPEDVFTVEKEKGNMGFKDDGRAFFTTVNKNGVRAEVESAEEMVKSIIERDPNKRKAPENRQEARKAFKEGR